MGDAITRWSNGEEGEEVQRIENWTVGTVPCPKCGKDVKLYFNGGELDVKECCGMVFATEHTQIDLVIRRFKEP